MHMGFESLEAVIKSALLHVGNITLQWHTSPYGACIPHLLSSHSKASFMNGNCTNNVEKLIQFFCIILICHCVLNIAKPKRSKTCLCSIIHSS